MKTIEHDVPLAELTTLRIGGCAEHLTKVETREEIREAVAWAKERNLQVRILGGGSNVLVSDGGLKGLVIRMNVTGIAYDERNDQVYVRAGAGVVFDKLVNELVEQGIWGLENLSGIPGSVGAVPIQNVGAYGVEVREFISSVSVFDRDTDAYFELQNDACGFSYRDSMFKHEKGKRYIIESVTFVLSRNEERRLGYTDLRARFSSNASPSQRDIREAVLEIRSRKFPDWSMVGTAGSFFKNPIVSSEKYEALRSEYPHLPGFETEGGTIKIPLGYILDKILGKRGYREGNVGLFENQALVLVNHGGATAKEVSSFARMIVEEIKDATGIDVEWEVTHLE